VCWVTGLPSHLAVGAIVRRGSDILLVADEEGWALPGGPVADDEPLGAALRRKVVDETGLAMVRPGRLLWIARYPVGNQAFDMLGFEVVETSTAQGRSPKPPAAWVSLDEAVPHLEQMWFSPIRDPAVAYLTGRAAAATLWTWSRLDAPPETVPELG
jgi:ADP-ribose pyrophosphatase YjhB (NUDIX family)